MLESVALFRFRLTMVFFIVGLLLSGITAFPLLAEMKLLASWLGLSNVTSPIGYTGLEFWILTVKLGLEDMYSRYPWIAYGTDWLAFGHITIALFFIAPLFKPAGSQSTIYAGIAACILVIPLALICGSIREIPFYWRLIDCSFGIIGVIPLLYCLYLLRFIQATGPKLTTSEV
jgi:hypothetical protein